jgi:hypothetical protein
LNRGQVPQIAAQGRREGLPLGVLELRDGDGGQYADDHHHDEQFDQGKAFRRSADRSHTGSSKRPAALPGK